MTLEQINQMEEDMIKEANKDAVQFLLFFTAFLGLFGLIMYLLKH